MADYLVGTAPDRYWPKTYVYWPVSGATPLYDIVAMNLFITRAATVSAHIAETLAKSLFITRVVSVELER